MGATMFESETMTVSNKALFVEAMSSGNYSLLLSASKETPVGPGVYCLFNYKLNRLYIGCSINVRSRISQHFTQLRNGQHVCHEMTIHYMSDPESFFAFCIEELDKSLLGPRNARLFRIESKAMLLAQKSALYNNITPVIESDVEFNPDANDFVSVSDICAAIDMSPDAIRANGLSITDSIDIDEAIEFVRKRTVAAGRWTQEKAEKALSYLSELEQIKSESNIQISWEYKPSHEKLPFAQAVADVLTPTSFQKSEIEKESIPDHGLTKRRDYGQTAFRLLFGGGILGHAFLILWDAAYLWGKGGLIAGVVVFLVITGSVVLMWKRREDQEANNLLWFVWFLEGIAGFVHKNALYHSGTNAYGAGITELGTACLAVVISLCAMAMSYFYFKTSK